MPPKRKAQGTAARKSKKAKTTKATKSTALISAVQNAEVQTLGYKLDSNKFSFLDLPPEIRIMIYEFTFHDSHIDIKVIRSGYDATAEAQPAQDFGHGLLRACKITRQESFNIAFKAVTLRWLRHSYPKWSWLHHKINRYAKPFDMPLQALALIQKVKYYSTPAALTPWESFSSLKEINLSHKVITFAGRSPHGVRAVQNAVEDKVGDFPLGIRYLRFEDVRPKITGTIWYLNARVERRGNIGWHLEYDYLNCGFTKTDVVEFVKTSTYAQRTAAKHDWFGGWDVNPVDADVEAFYKAEPI